jgi:predicted ribosome quality control (RQC) complex YloA/Tae2 family protein
LNALCPAEQLSKQGELLKAHLRELRAGKSTVTLRDFATDEPVEVPLEPKLRPRANLEAIFMRARLAEMRVRIAAGDIDAVRERIAALDALSAEADALGEGDALAAFAARPELERLLARYAPAPAAAAAPEAPK